MPNAQILAQSLSSVSNVPYDAMTDSNGSYSIEVPDGDYEVTGVYRPTYQGDTWELPLHPTDNSANPVSVSRGKSVTKDFEWLLDGPKPVARIQPSDPFSYYGASIVVEPSYLSFEWPENAVVDFTLEPTGPLMDGSTTQPLSDSRTVEQLNSENGALDETHYLYDIPIGPYELTAVLTMPDGMTYQLGLTTVYGSASFYESVNIQFQPSTIETTLADGPEPLTVYIDSE